MFLSSCHWYVMMHGTQIHLHHHPQIHKDSYSLPWATGASSSPMSWAGIISWLSVGGFSSWGCLSRGCWADGGPTIISWKDAPSSLVAMDLDLVLTCPLIFPNLVPRSTSGRVSWLGVSPWDWHSYCWPFSLHLYLLTLHPVPSKYSLKP